MFSWQGIPLNHSNALFTMASWKGTQFNLVVTGFTVGPMQNIFALETQNHGDFPTPFLKSVSNWAFLRRKQTLISALAPAMN